MLIGLTICLLIALLFGKITYKELKGYVREYTAKLRTPKRRAGGKGTGSTEGGKEGEERIPEEGCKERKDRRA
jgi:hypothetical protein